MPSPNVTYTFSNGTTADAGQVNTNFTDLINGAIDGTKDYNINSLTLAGNFTSDGNVTLGNGSGDALTINASLASNFLVGVNAAYDIGSSTLGLDTVYFGNGARTVGILAGVLTSTYTISLPVANPAITGKTFISDTNGVLSFRYPDKYVAAQTGTYTATGDETVIPCTPAASFDLSMPDVAVATGKMYRIYKTDSDINKIITVKTSGGSTISTINTQNESLTVISDGTTWNVLNRYIPSVWVSYDPTITGCGTPSVKEFFWRREGDTVHVRGGFKTGTISAATVTITLPGTTPINLDTAKTGSAKRILIGMWYGDISTAVNQTPDPNRGPYPLGYKSGTTNAIVLFQDVDLDNDATDTFFKEETATGFTAFASNTGVTVDFTIPVSGWNG